LHVIWILFYEGNGIKLVHHISGLGANVIGYPASSPDSRYFAALSMDLSASYNPNGIEICQLEDLNYKRVAYSDTE
jgi:hypothetical protein